MAFYSLLINYPLVPGVLVALIYACWRYYRYPKDHWRNDWFACAAVLCWPINQVGYNIVDWASRVRPWKYDLYIYAIDRYFGQPSFALGRIVARHWYLHDTVALVYGILPLVLVSLIAAHLWGRSRAESAEVIKAFVANLVLCLPIYLLIPVCGPEFAFPDFPNSPGHVEIRPILLAAPPNGIPSIHFSSALLILWYARHWRWGRILGSAFVLLTVLATLGSGQHYLFDLLAAVPYTPLIVFLAARRWSARPAPHSRG
jgi:hypothetical protein